MNQKFTNFINDSKKFLGELNETNIKIKNCKK